ncbi:MAG: matrixin family metalloprotease [Pseudomonadota bacterium]
MRPIRCIAKSAILASAIFALPAPSVQALTIVTTFVPEGDDFQFTVSNSSQSATASGQPGSARGGGNIQSVFNAAARYWERIFPGSGDTLEVDFGFSNEASLGSATQFATRTFSEVQGETRQGTIRFDATGPLWFLDATPLESSEFPTDRTINADLGGGEINTGREFGAASGSDAAGAFDLFSVALHEIGHLLGLANLENTDPFPGTLTIGSDIDTPFAVDGSIISLTEEGGGHIDQGATNIPETPANDAVVFDNALLITTIAAGERRLASDADILTIAQLSGFDTAALDQAGFISTIPLPGPATLLISALAGLGLNAARRRGKVSA